MILTAVILWLVAVIFLIIIISLILMKCVEIIERRAMPWRHTDRREELNYE